jgi:hypothetical protein
MPTSAKEFLERRGLADLSLYWPTNKPLPQIDYESGEAKPTLIELLEQYSEAARPPVPQQGQGDENVREFFGEYFHAIQNRKYGSEEVIAFCQTYLSRLAASRSEEATPQPIQLDTAVRHLAEEIGSNFLLSKGDMWREQVEWIHTHIKELVDFASRAPAAGSTERETPNLDQKLGLHYEITVWYVVDGYEARFEHERTGVVKQAHGQTVIEAILNLEKNMTDTDVAKEKL